MKYEIKILHYYIILSRRRRESRIDSVSVRNRRTERIEENGEVGKEGG